MPALALQMGVDDLVPRVLAFCPRVIRPIRASPGVSSM